MPSFSVLSTIHTSFTVSDVGRSLLFWRDVMGYVLVRRGRASGEMVINLTGLANTDIELAVLEGAGHVIELIQYNSPLDRRSVAPRPCDIGAAHVALSVDNIDAAAGEMTQHGWKVAGAIVLESAFGKSGRIHSRLGRDYGRAHRIARATGCLDAANVTVPRDET